MTQTSELVLQVFNNYFGSEPEAQELLSHLLGYEGYEPARVQLAILKLSDGDSTKLHDYIETARLDYRDVLAWAEYPQQNSSGATRYNTDLDEYVAILKADRQQYEAWLEGQRG
jgi:hypothetical protein